jgi:mannose-1-phosphate guanylyltransferase/mannose-6-phosphate isomerase
MEWSDKVALVPVEMGWSDIGSWDAVWDNAGKDLNANAIRGDVIAIDSRRSLIRNESNIMVATVGVEDLVVIATRDAVLITPRDKSQEAKRVVEELERQGRTTHHFPHQVRRPWGTFETTDKGSGFQTKRIIVKPGEKLSLQLHHHRSEHWIVVSGTARVTIGDEVGLLHENQATFIPSGTVHRLENPGTVPLHVIEVQCGSYLGEDDIVRLEDCYGRIHSIKTDS